MVVAAIAAWMFGAWICIKPWLEEFRAQNKHLENETLATALEQVQRIEEVAARIQTATGSWQSAQEAATRTAAAAKEIEEKIRATTKEFIDFQERVHSDEKRHMSLEIEKLRKVEADWLQVSARMLDHTYMLHQAAQRSGQENLINQLGVFQNAVRDTARRMGLVPFTPVVGERFDNRGHQTETPNVEPPADSIVTEVLATGFTFQGQLLRRALVRVGNAIQEPPASEGPAESVEAPEPTETQAHDEESAARTKQETEESIAADDTTGLDREVAVASRVDGTEAMEISERSERAFGEAEGARLVVSESVAETIEPATHVEESAARTKQETEEAIAADDTTRREEGSSVSSEVLSRNGEGEAERPRRRTRRPDPQTSLPF